MANQQKKNNDVNSENDFSICGSCEECSKQDSGHLDWKFSLLELNHKNKYGRKTQFCATARQIMGLIVGFVGLSMS